MHCPVERLGFDEFFIDLSALTSDVTGLDEVLQSTQTHVLGVRLSWTEILGHANSPPARTNAMPRH